MSKPEFKVWWIPQIPGKAFEVEVQSRDEGKRLEGTLALYDIFQFENKIKPDYCNTGGVVFRLEGLTDGEWWDADDDDDWADYVKDYPELEEARS
jgi:hypothetical protein